MLATIGSQIGQFAERKRAEAELATLFETSPDMLCIAGLDGTFRRLNPAWEKTLGFTTAELMSRPYVEFVHPDDRRATSAEAGAIADGEGSAFFENRYLCKDGSFRWLSWKSTPVPGEGLIYAVARDVTEQRRVAGGAAARARGRGRGEPGQGRLPRQHEPRDPDPDERRHRDGRAAARHAPRPRAAGVPGHPQGRGGVAPGAHQRRARLLEDRGRAARPEPGRVRPAGSARGHPAHAGPARTPEGPRARRADRPRRARPPRGRRAAAAPGARQPGGQRHQVHGARRGGGAGRDAGGGGGGGRPRLPGGRHRDRHPPGQAGADLRGLRPGRRLDHARVRGHRPRPLDLRPARGADGRPHHRRERARARLPLPLLRPLREGPRPRQRRRPAAGQAPRAARARGGRQR